MFSSMIGLSHYFKIAHSVVIQNSVFVMNHLRRLKVPFKVFFHDKPVPENVCSKTVWIWMSRGVNQNSSCEPYDSSSPFGVPFSGF